MADRVALDIVFDRVYALAQHERLDYKHAEGKAKYLEDNMDAYQPRFEAALAAMQAKAMKGGGTIEEVERRIRDGMKEVVRTVADAILADSVRDAPIETGALRGSGRVETVND